MAGSGSKPQYAVALTLRFLVLTVSGVALLGFGVGRASRGHAGGRQLGAADNGRDDRIDRCPPSKMRRVTATAT